MTATPNKDRVLAAINSCENPRLMLTLLSMLLSGKTLEGQRANKEDV